MKIEINQLKQIIDSSLNEVFDQRSKYNNFKRSSRFLTVLSEKIHKKWFKDKILNLQKTDKKGITIPGEWLYDMCITERIEIQDEKYPATRGKINTNILFAIECEFSTSIREFAQDFGKLICSSANQILFIQGLNQEFDNREDFIIRRKKIVEKNFNGFGKDLFLAFVPSPAKKAKKESFWDSLDNPSEWIEIYFFDNKKGEFFNENNLYMT